MMSEACVHIVDDDEALRDALVFLFRSRGVPVRAFASAEDFLAARAPDLRGCILSDVRMEGMSGLELFERLRIAGSRLPFLILTGHGDVPMAVEALKKGAHDFVEKPFNDNDLVDKVIAAIADDAERAAQELHRRTIGARLLQLSAREREVMERLLSGSMNKVIADDLGITMRTVEVHRARIFEKMGVRSAVELANLMASAGRQG